MTRKELRESVERFLQGKRNERWSDSEINTYLNEAQLEFCRLSKIPETEYSDLSISSSPTPISGVVSVGGRTVSLTSATVLTTLAVDDSVLVEGSTNTYIDGGHLVTKIVKSSAAIAVTSINIGTEVITTAAHGLTTGDKVIFTISSGVDDLLPPELSASIAYYVTTVVSETRFKVSTTLGGTALSFSVALVGTSTIGASTFEYLLPENISQTSTGEAVTYVETGPVFTKPATILEITSVTLDGRELAIYTQSGLDRAANSGSDGVRMVQPALGATPSPFYTLDASFYPKKWRDSQGKLEAVVISERSASSFRIFPLPSEPEHVYIDKDASTKVSQGFIIRGVLNPTKMTLDTETPQIPESFHEALVYGALDRAYLKESQLRNVDKSNMFRGRFLSLVGEAQRNEGLNSGSIGGGRNELRIRVAR